MIFKIINYISRLFFAIKHPPKFGLGQRVECEAWGWHGYIKEIKFDRSDGFPEWIYMVDNIGWHPETLLKKY